MTPLAMAGRRALRRLLPKKVALAARREWLAYQVARGRAYQEGEIDLLPRFVRAGDVCWDVGANVGTYTVALSRLAARVIAFEPVPHNFDILDAVIHRARLSNVTATRLALADASGEARMAVPTEGFYGGYYMAALDAAGDVPVTTSSVDLLIASGWAEPAFIKCDVEGAEDRVLLGARGLIARRMPVWLLETFRNDVLELAASLGYILYINDFDTGELQRVTALVETHRNYWLLPPSPAR